MSNLKDVREKVKSMNVKLERLNIKRRIEKITSKMKTLKETMPTKAPKTGFKWKQGKGGWYQIKSSKPSGKGLSKPTMK